MQIYIRVHTTRGGSWTTRFSGTLEDAAKYYIGQPFTMGTGERMDPERTVVAVSVELLAPTALHDVPNPGAS